MGGRTHRKPAGEVRSLWDDYTGLCKRIREKELQSGLNPSRRNNCWQPGKRWQTYWPRFPCTGKDSKSKAAATGTGQKERGYNHKDKGSQPHWDENHMDYITRIKADNVEYNRLINWWKNTGVGE